MKKVVATILSLVILSASFAGCGPKTDNTGKTDSAPSSKEETKGDAIDKGEKVTLTYWQHSSEARDKMMNSIVKDFETENPNIKVKLEFIPFDDYTQKLIPALATDNAPDVFQVQSGMVGRLAKAGSIQPIDETILSVADIEKEFVKSTVDGLKVDGKYYGLPTDTQTIILYWNKALLKAEGLDAEKGPQTWTELFDYARKLTKIDGGQMSQSGWGHNGYHPEVQSIVDQYGGKFYDAASGKFVFADDPVSVQAIKEMADSIRVDKVYNAEFMKTWAGFRQGKVAMMLGHPAMLGNLATTAPDVDFGVSLIPGKDGKRNSCVTSWGYVMSKKAPAEAASTFINYLGSEKVEKNWTMTTGELPPRISLLTDSEIIANPKTKVAIDSLNESFVGALQTSAQNVIWSKAYEQIMLTTEPLDKILQDCQKQLNEEVAKDLK